VWCGAVRRWGRRAGRGGHLARENAGEGGTTERDDKQGNQAGDDAHPLRATQTAA
jgi:hypothetical protein